MQSNLAKQLAKLVKVKYVEDISAAARVGKQLSACGVACQPHLCMYMHVNHLHTSFIRQQSCVAGMLKFEHELAVGQGIFDISCQLPLFQPVVL